MNNLMNIAYETLFSMYIMENTPISDIDKMFDEVLGGNVDESKLIGIGSEIPGLKYFTLISRPHCDRLSNEDKEVFDRLVEKQRDEDYYIAHEIIERTYKDVMCINPKEPDKMTCLGPYPDAKFCFDNDAIVLGIKLDSIMDVSEEKGKRIAVVVDNMKTQLFEEISRDINAKLELYADI